MDSIIFEACLNNFHYLLGLILNGLIVGAIYALMAIGLTVIFSVLGIVSFAHGEFYMIGGFVTYFLLENLIDIDIYIPVIGTIATIAMPWYVAILLSGVVTFFLGSIFEQTFLRPMFSGKVERPGEYAILVTFGLAFFLQYLTLAIIGPFPVKADRFVSFDIPKILGQITIASNRIIAASVAVIAIGSTLYYLQRTWTGRALRAVSQDKDAAAVTGINPQRMNRFAFGLGCMLAGMAGATLVQVFSWVFDVGVVASAKSFVIIVLGGMGSVPGALFGGLIIGVVEALGTGCFPDPSRSLAYRDAFGLIIFALILLFRPQGFFGRKL
jgi:branched-chain amino acid transport system permease protein